MNTEDLGKSKVLNLIFKPAGMMMGSRLRAWLMNPVKTLQGGGVEPGQTILEVGCGTGFSRYRQQSLSAMKAAWWRWTLQPDLLNRYRKKCKR